MSDFNVQLGTGPVPEDFLLRLSARDVAMNIRFLETAITDVLTTRELSDSVSEWGSVARLLNEGPTGVRNPASAAMLAKDLTESLAEAPSSALKTYFQRHAQLTKRYAEISYGAGIHDFTPALGEQIKSATPIRGQPKIKQGTRLAILDLETTGLTGDVRIAEIGIKVYEFGKKGWRPALDRSGRRIRSAHLHKLVNIGIPWSDQVGDVLSISQLTEEMVGSTSRADKWRRVAPKVAKILADPNMLIAAYNTQFDLPLLEKSLASVGINADFSKRAVDVLSLVRAAFPEQGSYKQQDLASDFGIDAGRAHRAMDDVKTTRKLMERALGVLWSMPAKVREYVADKVYGSAWQRLLPEATTEPITPEHLAPIESIRSSARAQLEISADVPMSAAAQQTADAIAAVSQRAAAEAGVDGLSPPAAPSTRVVQDGVPINAQTIGWLPEKAAWENPAARTVKEAWSLVKDYKWSAAAFLGLPLLSTFMSLNREQEAQPTELDILLKDPAFLQSLTSSEGGKNVLQYHQAIADLNNRAMWSNTNMAGILDPRMRYAHLGLTPPPMNSPRIGDVASNMGIY